MIKELIKLADHLDSIGHGDYADILDNLMPDIAYELDALDNHYEDNYMLESQLSSISEKALKIKDAIKSGSIAEDWMETYIAQADLMIDNIYDRIFSGEDTPLEDMFCKKCRGKCHCDK
jgi:hypothetical protein